MHLAVDYAGFVEIVPIGEPLGGVFWPLGVLCFCARDGRGSRGGVSSHGGFCGNTGGVGVLDNWASN